MTPLPAPSLPDRLRAHAHLHPESAELLREAADRIDLDAALLRSSQRVQARMGADVEKLVRVWEVVDETFATVAPGFPSQAMCRIADLMTGEP